MTSQEDKNCGIGVSKGHKNWLRALFSHPFRFRILPGFGDFLVELKDKKLEDLEDLGDLEEKIYLFDIGIFWIIAIPVAITLWIVI
jgi:hypothetical protein